MRRDIKYDEHGDINLSTGDIVYTESTAQHQYDLLMAAPGDYKQSPLSGVDSGNDVNDNEPTMFLRSVRKQMQSDGMNVKRVAWEYGQLVVDADYEDSNG